MATRSSRKPRVAKESVPAWSPNNSCITFTTADLKRWYSILSIRCYDCIDPVETDVLWNDKQDKNDNTIETCVRVSSKNDVNCSVAISLYQNGKIMIQGQAIQQWVDEEYPLLQSVHSNTDAKTNCEILEACKALFANNPTFISWLSPEENTELQVQDFVTEITDLVSANCWWIKASRFNEASASAPAVKAKKPKMAKRKPVEGEEWIKTASTAINNMDSRISTLPDEITNTVAVALTDYVDGLFKPVVAESRIMRDELEQTKNSIIELSTNYLDLQNKIKKQNSLTSATIQAIINDVGLIKDKLDTTDTENLNQKQARKGTITTIKRELASIKDALESIKETLKNTSAPTGNAPVLLPPAPTKRPIMHLNENNFDGWLLEPTSIYIGGASCVGREDIPKSVWENPFTEQLGFSEKNSMELYERYVMDGSMRSQLLQLKGKQLGTFHDRGRFNHGIVLLKLVRECDQPIVMPDDTPDGIDCTPPEPASLPIPPTGWQSQSIISPINSPPPVYTPQALENPQDSTHNQAKANNGQAQGQSLTDSRSKFTQNQSQMRRRGGTIPKTKPLLQPGKPNKELPTPINISILIDSNRREIDFEKLFPIDYVEVIKCGSTAFAVTQLSDYKLNNPNKVILHLGTNDLQTLSANEFVQATNKIASSIEQEYSCEVIISEILPRADKVNNLVAPANEGIRRLRWKSIPHPSINTHHLHDTKHLNRFPIGNDSLSGSQLLAVDIYKAMYGREPLASRLTYHQARYSNNGRRGR